MDRNSSSPRSDVVTRCCDVSCGSTRAKLLMRVLSLSLSGLATSPPLNSLSPGNTAGGPRTRISPRMVAIRLRVTYGKIRENFGTVSVTAATQHRYHNWLTPRTDLPLRQGFGYAKSSVSSHLSSRKLNITARRVYVSLKWRPKPPTGRCMDSGP